MIEFNTPIGTFKTGEHNWDDLVMSDRADRITRLIEDRGMTPKAAATVVDAAMFGIGCLEGTIRKKIQEEIDAKKR